MFAFVRTAATDSFSEEPFIPHSIRNDAVDLLQLGESTVAAERRSDTRRSDLRYE